MQGLPVLVVEDEPTTQKVLTLLIQHCGLDAQIASSLSEAVDAAQNGEYALILMDWRLPDGDGLECTRRMRTIERSRTRHTPIVAITANALVGDRQRCLDSGMDEYLSKPFTLEQFRQMVSRFVTLPEAAKVRTKDFATKTGANRTQLSES